MQHKTMMWKVVATILSAGTATVRVIAWSQSCTILNSRFQNAKILNSRFWTVKILNSRFWTAKILNSRVWTVKILNSRFWTAKILNSRFWTAKINRKRPTKDVQTRTTTWNLPGPSGTRDCINISRTPPPSSVQANTDVIHNQRQKNSLSRLRLFYYQAFCLLGLYYTSHRLRTNMHVHGSLQC